jgi:septal ring factor EnvC (AmiA/AmiB activator)
LSYANPIRLNAKLAALSAMVGSADAAPTRQSHAVFDEFSAKLAEQQAHLRTVEAELNDLDARVRATNSPIIGG